MSSNVFRVMYTGIGCILLSGFILVTGIDFSKAASLAAILIALDLRAKWLFAELALSSILKTEKEPTLSLVKGSDDGTSNKT